jgi:hypothetical protein
VSAIYWGKQQIGTETIDLSHLDPFMFGVTPRAEPTRTINVIASFGLHTFTKEREDTHPVHLHMGTVNDPRTFCFDRLKCSLKLREIIMEASRGRVCFSHRENFLIARNLAGVTGQYAAIFKIEKSPAPNVVRMFVISAHERLRPLPVLKEINFVKLVTNVSDGVAIVRPK